MDKKNSRKNNFKRENGNVIDFNREKIKRKNAGSGKSRKSNFSSEDKRTDKNSSPKKKASKEKNNRMKSNTKQKNGNKRKPSTSGKVKHINIRKKKKMILGLILVILLGISAYSLKSKFNGNENTQIQLSANSNEKEKISDNVIKPSEKDEDSSQSGIYDVEDESQKANKRYTIVIDPGHGGEDTGSSDSSGKIYEENISLRIGKKIAIDLSREDDVNVIVTRTDDKGLSIEERTEFAQKNSADMIVSIHTNTQGSKNDAEGLETWYNNDGNGKAKNLAQYIQKTASAYVDIQNRGTLESKYEILGKTGIPTVIVQCGFISNEKDAENMNNAEYQDKFAEGISQGILAYIDSFK